VILTAVTNADMVEPLQRLVHPGAAAQRSFKTEDESFVMKKHPAIRLLRWIFKTLFMRAVLCLVGGILVLSGSSQACFIAGDLNGDCQVDFEDVALAASQWMQASCDAETGLVVHWKLDESSGSTAVDSSGSGYDGAVVGARWNPTGGVLGGALQFDGDNDYVSATQGYEGVVGSNPRTCAAWVKTDQPPGGIMTWGDVNVDTNGWSVWLEETGVLRVDVGAGHILGTTVLADDLWHHIAVTSDGSTTDNIVLYVDGRIETTAEVVSQSINTHGTVAAKLGVSVDGIRSINYFDGLIDDARIYDRVLTMKEIWSVAATGTTSYSCPDLNADEVVNFDDFAKLSRNWEDETPPVLISEFMADNESKSPLEGGEILDGNYESSDWIELHNNSEVVVDISGWYLTDESNLKTKWRFPFGMGQLVLQPGDYLIVFASGKTQAENPGNYPYEDPAGYLHTNFQLSKSGEYLALIAADGTTPIHEYSHFEHGGDEYGYPAQEENISYGYYYGEARYFSEPTPGADNAKSPFEEFVEKPDVSVKGGCYVDAVDVTISCGTEGAFIQYTTDGTVPSMTNGTEYTAPIHVDSLTTILAKAFKPGLQPSATRIETYIFVRPDVAPFNSNLPIVVVDTLGVDIPNDRVLKTYVDCRVVIIDTDGVTGRAVITGPEHFEGWGQIRRRGESTYGQGHYALEIQDEYNNDKGVSLLGMPAESDWILSNDVIDYSMMKNEIAFKWFRDMGHYAPRQRYVELYLNTGGGKISTSDYKGLFMLREKIKRNDDRVDIARLDASHNLEPQVSGGYIIKNDKEDTGDTVLNLETSPYGIVIDGVTSIVEPNPSEVTNSQIAWIEGYIDEFHAVLWQNKGSAHYVSGADYTDYVEETSWIDNFIVEQIAFDADAFRFSFFIHKDRDGKLCSGPPWDFDRAFHNNAGNYDRPYDSWNHAYKIPWAWNKQLLTYPEYSLMLADRWFEHREDVLNTAQTMAYIDQTADLISEARSRPKKTYPKPFTEEVQLFKDWITHRLDWMDGEIANRFAQKPPIISPSGGYANQGDSLEMSKPSGASGTIYYTLNGEDPRLAGGGINPNASIFTPGGSPSEDFESGMGSWINITGDTDDWHRESGRTPSSSTGPDSGAGGSTWYIYMETSNNYCNDNGDTAILEGPTVEGTDLELSFYYHMYGSSIGTLYVDVYSGGSWTNGVWSRSGQQHAGYSSPYTPATVDLSSYATPLKVRFRGVAAGGSKGDIAIDDIDMIGGSIAGGDELTLSGTTCVRARIKDGGDWSAQNKEVYAVGPILENLRISELMYHPTDPTPAEIAATGNPDLIDEDFEFIELKNIGRTPINLNLVHFTDGIDFTFGHHTLAAGQYTVLVKNQAAFAARYGTSGINIVPGTYVGSLDNDGEEIVLRDALGAEIHDFDYNDDWRPHTDGDGFSLTIIDPTNPDPNSWDEKDSWRASAYIGGSPGEDDSGILPNPGAIAINEIMAHSHALAPDWIELYNTTGELIEIGGWYISDSASDLKKYRIADGETIGGYSYKLFYEDTHFGEFSNDPGRITGFAFSENGDEMYLSSAEAGELTGYREYEDFGASPMGVSFGRYFKASTGNYNFLMMDSNTPGRENSDPKVGPIVINEIMYNPASGNQAEEYIELYNITSKPVALYDSAEGLPWKFTDGIDYTFPDYPGLTIPGNKYVLIVKDVPAYISAYGTPPSGVLVLGPYTGSLSNGGEKLELSMPGDEDEFGTRHYIRVDRVNYSDGSHHNDAPNEIDLWPVEADAGGKSLTRKVSSDYGNDPDNWEAAEPSPGSPG